MLQIIDNRKTPFVISGLLFLASVFLLVVFGLKPGIDFSGGALVEIRFTGVRPSISDVQKSLAPLSLGSVQVQPSDDKNMILRMRFVTEDEHQRLLAALRGLSRPETNVTSTSATPSKNIAVEPPAQTITVGDQNEAVLDVNLPSEIKDSQSGATVLEERFETIGPNISAQLRRRSFWAAIMVVFALLIYIAYVFRKVSKPVPSWQYGVAAIIALVHDVTITMGVFAILGKYLGVEVDVPFVVALLTILGYSVNDTIVVFDRVRENLIKRGSDRFAETVNLGVNQTIMRSINTSFATLLTLFAMFFFGGETIHYFSLTLIIGFIVGTYSSIFVASPLLVEWAKWRRRA